MPQIISCEENFLVLVHAMYGSSRPVFSSRSAATYTTKILAYQFFLIEFAVAPMFQPKGSMSDAAMMVEEAYQTCSGVSPSDEGQDRVPHSHLQPRILTATAETQPEEPAVYSR